MSLYRVKVILAQNRQTDGYCTERSHHGSTENNTSCYSYCFKNKLIFATVKAYKKFCATLYVVRYTTLIFI